MKTRMIFIALLLLLIPALAHADIHKAVWNGNIAEVEKCLERGEDINQTDDGGFTPVMIAADRGDLAMIKVLLSYNPKLEERHEGAKSTALILAAASGNPEIVRLLIEAGAKVNAVDAEERTALFYTDKVAIADILIKAGVDINAKAMSGATALTYQYRFGDVAGQVSPQQMEYLRFLIKNGADVNINEGGDMTPLMIAAQNGQTEIIKLLLANKARIDAVDANGQTALIVAVNAGRAASVKLLLAKGADAKLKDSRGYSALNYASENGLPEIEKMLKAAGGK